MYPWDALANEKDAQTTSYMIKKGAWVFFCYIVTKTLQGSTKKPAMYTYLE